MTGLDLTLLYLLAAVLGVVACRLMKLPPMLGYLGVGVAIGPNALALAQNTAGLHYLAEFGVVFLMFVIGLEFSLPKLYGMRRHVFGLGAAQVVLTILWVALGSWGLAKLWPEHWHMAWQTAVALGGILAMSSTAIVMKMMAERMEIESAHGKRVVGVLLFQDLAVVPLLVLIPALGSPSETLVASLSVALLKAVVVLAVLLWGGQKCIRWWLMQVAKRQSEELFMLNLLLIALGLAWVTDWAGLSLALGAFVAGMLIAETEFRHQVQTDIRPFHDVLLGLFFITVGMMLDWHVVWAQWPLVLVLLMLPVLFKAVLTAVLSRLFYAGPGIAIRVGLYLAQAGEFGLVLLTLAKSNGLVGNQQFNPILAAMVLSMMATPFIIMSANAIVARLARSDWLFQSLQMTRMASQAMGMKDHIIICGYGRCGQNMARLCEQAQVDYMALDLDPDRVQKTAASGERVAFGDARRLPDLMAAGVLRAKAVAITYLDVQSSLKVLAHIQKIAPNTPVVVRTVDDANLEQLQQAGATEVVPEAIEGSLMLTSHVLALVGVPMRKVLRLVQAQREARYSLLKGYLHGDQDDAIDMGAHEVFKSMRVSEGAPCLGLTLQQLWLSTYPVRLISLRALDGQQLTITDSAQLKTGDTLVLCGAAADLQSVQSQWFDQKGGLQ